MKNICILILILSLCFQFTGIHAQESAVIRGRVTEKSSGEPLPGVNVVELDDQNRVVKGVITDINGNYVLEVNNAEHAIRVSFVGYEIQRFNIQGRSTINVTLEEQTVGLEEVTVTATSQANEMTGVAYRDQASSSTRIDMDKLSGVSGASAADALQGQVSGLDIMASTGSPGSGSSIVIRGMGTIGNANPLIVVDGIAQDVAIGDFNFAAADQRDLGQLLNIAPQDIQTVDVLKDAAATAVWGSKGANGVLMITTKQGTRGKIQFTYDYKLSSNQQPPSIPMLSGDQYITLQLEEWHNARGVYDIPQEIAFNRNYVDFYNYSANTDWLDEITKNAWAHEHYFQMQGGGENSRFLTSMNYLNEASTVINSGYRRFTVRVNFDYNISDDLRIATYFNYTNSKKEDLSSLKVGGENIRSMAYVKSPNMSIWEYDQHGDPTGEYFNPIESYQGSGDNYYNPVAVASLGMNDVLQNRIENNFKVNYNPFLWLRFRETISFQYQNEKGNKFLPSSAIGADWLDNDINAAEELNKSNIKLFSRTQAFLNPLTGVKNHNLTMSLMWEMEQKQQQDINLQNSNSASLFINDPASSARINSTNSGSSVFRLFGALANVNYIWLDRYIFNFNLRGDASSVFGESNRWGVFPSVAFGWRFSGEPFMQGLAFLGDSKLRFSWGKAGKSPNNPYARHAQYRTGGQYMLFPVIIPDQIQLARLRWETATSFNAGAELNFFDNRLNVNADIYTKVTSDLQHNNYVIPSYTGYNKLAFYNGGELENVGWEYYMNGELIRNRQESIFWSMSFNVSQNINSFLSFPTNFIEEVGTSVGNGVYPRKAEVGKPIGSFYGFRYLGVYPTDEDAYARDDDGNILRDGNGRPIHMTYKETYQFEGGDAIYEDINQDGKIDIMDAVYIGDSSPEFIGGFGTRFRYKQITASVNFHYRTGFDIVNQVASLTEGMNNTHNQSRAALHRWRRSGQDEEGMLPRAYMNHIANNLGSDRYVEKGNFVRLNNVSLDYRLNPDIAQRFNVTNLSIGIRMRKLLTFTNYSGQDPEIGQSSTNPFWLGVDDARTPVPKEYSMNIKVNF